MVEEWKKDMHEMRSMALVNVPIRLLYFEVYALNTPLPFLHSFPFTRQCVVLALGRLCSQAIARKLGVIQLCTSD